MPAFFVVTFAIVSAVQTYVVHRLETAPADTDEELRLAAYREEVLNRCECDGIAVSAISTSWNSPVGASAPPNVNNPHDKYSDMPQGTERPLRQPKRNTFADIAGRTSVASANESAAASPLCTSGYANTSKPAGPATSVERESAPSFVEEWLNRLSVSIVVILFLLFPPIVQACTRMLTCEDLDYGDKGTKRVLMVDRSIDCDSSAYLHYRAAAVALLIVYGAGIPLASVAIVKAVAASKRGGLDEARRLFFFTTGGFCPRWWMWEGAILVRKAAIVVIVAGVTNQRLRIFCSMWTMGLFLALNVLVMPWNDLQLSRLEALSLVTITITFNASLIFTYTTQDGNPVLFFCAAVVIVAVNIVALLAFVSMAAKALPAVLREMGLLSDGPRVETLEATVQKREEAVRLLREELVKYARQHGAGSRHQHPEGEPNRRRFQTGRAALSAAPPRSRLAAECTPWHPPRAAGTVEVRARPRGSRSGLSIVTGGASCQLGTCVLSLGVMVEGLGRKIPSVAQPSRISLLPLPAVSFWFGQKGNCRRSAPAAC